MNKRSIVDYLHANFGGTQSKAEAVVDGLIKLITDTLVSGGEVSIAGFGIFATKKRGARVARNPKTGEAVQVAERRVAKFKPAKALRDAVL